MKAERDYLHNNALRKRREKCESEGFQFQTIDLRWGVSNEAAWDQRTETLCMGEIRRCQEITPRPNFIALVGQRYGWRPLPLQLTELDWIFLLEQAGERVDLLKNWYTRDENNIPVVYRLRSRETEQERDADYWRDAVEVPLHELFGLAVGNDDAGVLSGPVRESDLSLTEKEIQLGAENASQNQWEAFAYFRELADVNREQLSEPWVDRLESGGMADSRSGEKLAGLKDRLLANRNVTARTVEANIVQHGEEEKISQAALIQLDQMILDDLTIAIDKQIEDYRAVRPLDREISTHDAFAQQRRRNYIERQREELAIENYVRGPMNKPLVLCGASGAGKTSLLARVKERVENQYPNTVCVSRFVGATGDSSSLRSLIRSIHQEIAERVGGEDQSESMEADARQSFRTALAIGSTATPVVVLIDALDQLSSDDSALTGNWIPRELTENCRLIVSCMSDEQDSTQHGSGVFGVLEGRLDSDSILAVSQPNLDDLQKMLTQWLASYGRTLSESQRGAVLAALANCPRPLYLRVMVELAKSWTVEHLPSKLPDSIHGIIGKFLDEMEAAGGHGKMLVQSTLGLLTASRSGLMETELVTILGRDQDVLAEFNETRRYEYPDARENLPPAIWSRLLFDFDFFLGTTTAAQAHVINFYHRQLEAVARGRYLEPNEKSIRRGLIDFFGTSSAWFNAEQSVANSRRAFEYPYQLFSLGDEMSMTQLERLLMDDQHVNSKIAAELSNDLLADYFLVDTIEPQVLNPIVDFFVTRYVDDESSLASQFRPRDLHSFFTYRRRNSGGFYEAVLLSLTGSNGNERSERARWLSEKAKVDMGGVLRRQKKFADALLNLDVVNQADSALATGDLGVAWYEIGYLRYVQDQYATAADAMARSVQYAKEGGDEVGAAISGNVEIWARYFDDSENANLSEIIDQLERSLELFTRNRMVDGRAFRWVMNALMHLIDAAYLVGDEEMAIKHMRDLRANPWVREFESPGHILPYEARTAMAGERYSDACSYWEKLVPTVKPDAEGGAWLFYDYGVSLRRSGRTAEARERLQEGLQLEKTGVQNAYWQQRIELELEDMANEGQ